MFGGVGLGSLVIGVWKVVLAQGFKVEWNASAGCTYYGGLNSSNRVLDATIMFLRKHQKSSGKYLVPYIKSRALSGLSLQFV